MRSKPYHYGGRRGLRASNESRQRRIELDISKEWVTYPVEPERRSKEALRQAVVAHMLQLNSHKAVIAALRNKGVSE